MLHTPLPFNRAKNPSVNLLLSFLLLGNSSERKEATTKKKEKASKLKEVSLTITIKGEIFGIDQSSSSDFNSNCIITWLDFFIKIGGGAILQFSKKTQIQQVLGFQGH